MRRSTVDVTDTAGENPIRGRQATLEALQALAKTPVTRENWRLIAAQLELLQIPGKQDIIADWERIFSQSETIIPEEVTDYGGPGFMVPQ